MVIMDDIMFLWNGMKTCDKCQFILLLLDKKSVIIILGTIHRISCKTKPSDFLHLHLHPGTESGLHPGGRSRCM
jgi:hypothetical protein